MGSWAKNIFGSETFDKIGIVMAGYDKEEFEKELLGCFDGVISSKDVSYHAHLVKKNNLTMPFVFNIYGAPAVVDALAEMHDGGCRNVIFVGYAYGGFKNLDIGAIVIPDKSYHFDGIYHPIEPDRKTGLPDKELKEKLEKVFKKNKVNFVNGTNISVPAVTFQLPHANEEYKKINPSTVEMELAAFFSRAKDIGMRAAGVLVISDNRSTSIGDKTKNRLKQDAKRMVLELIAENISEFGLDPLKVKKEFKIDSYLASVIADPADETNVYRGE